MGLVSDPVPRQGLITHYNPSSFSCGDVTPFPHSDSNQLITMHTVRNEVQGLAIIWMVCSNVQYPSDWLYLRVYTNLFIAKECRWPRFVQSPIKYIYCGWGPRVFLRSWHIRCTSLINHGCILIEDLSIVHLLGEITMFPDLGCT